MFPSPRSFALALLFLTLSPRVAMGADLSTEADAPASPPMVGELTAVERGPHHRIMEWLSQSTDESGNS